MFQYTFPAPYYLFLIPYLHLFRSSSIPTTRQKSQLICNQAPPLTSHEGHAKQPIISKYSRSRENNDLGIAKYLFLSCNN